MRLRRYCWRTGLVMRLEDGERCPECGFTNHKPIDRQDLCGCFAPVKSLTHTPRELTGAPCALPIGHEGPHMTEDDLFDAFDRVPASGLVGGGESQ